MPFINKMYTFSSPRSGKASMEASTGPLILSAPPPLPNLEKIKEKLLKHGVQPTPRILHNLRKKEIQKFNRREAKERDKLPPPLSDAQKQAIAEESNFQLIKSEYKKFKKSLGDEEGGKLVGKPWERLERLRLRELASESAEHDSERLKPEHLMELSEIIECEREKFAWLLENDVEIEEGWFENDERRWAPKKRSETEAIKLLVDRMSATELNVKDWKFTRIMRYSGLQFTERQMLKIVDGLGDKGQWKSAVSVVQWLYNSKEHRLFKSRFVYTKLLAVLGRARKPHEALQVFSSMRADADIYPDMAAYHSLAVTLGQGGFVRELINVVESMKERPKRIKNMRRKNWNPELQPDIVVFNAVLNACVPTCQWKGVSWVFQQLRKSGLRPNGASYGLAMEVMLKSGKYDHVHAFFDKMKKSGEALKALTYKVLVRAFWDEGKVYEAVQAVRDMERRGVIGTASVYYELARCLCFYGRWQDAIVETERLKNLCATRPLAVTFTGIIMSSLDGGHVHDCVSLFEYSKTLVAPDIGLLNAMLKVYGRNDMFLKAKEIFEMTIRDDSSPDMTEPDHDSFPRADAYTFSSMLEASANALQWEYFEYVYKEMTLSGHRVDPRKYSDLLVEASKAGKWHLLEHAFEEMLEAGDIPTVSVFTEMALRAIIRHDFERAINIINTMAYAPFQVSFQDWIDFFERSGNRIQDTCLDELRKKLFDQDLVTEATVLNFSRALDIILESSRPSTSPTMEEVQEESLCREFHDSNKHIVAANTPNTSLDWNLSTVEVSSINTGRDSAQFNEPLDYDLVTKISAEFEGVDPDGIHSDNELDFELVVPTSDMEDSEESGTPSAYEILEIWKKI